jgi:hypothetical protein
VGRAQVVGDEAVEDSPSVRVRGVSLVGEREYRLRRTRGGPLWRLPRSHPSPCRPSLSRPHLKSPRPEPFSVHCQRPQPPSTLLTAAEGVLILSYPVVGQVGRTRFVSDRSLRKPPDSSRQTEA